MIRRNLLLCSLLCLLNGVPQNLRAQDGDDDQPEMRDPGQFRGPSEGGRFGGGPFGGGRFGGGGPFGEGRGFDRGGDRGDGDSDNGGDRRSRRFDRGGQGGDRSGQSPGRGETKSKVRVGRVGPKRNLPPTTLPGQYASKDGNKDGQIGMYEWSKTDLSAFRKLDVNGDGFLTPAELISPGSAGGNSSSYASTTAPSSSGSNRASTPAPTGPPADLKTVAAQGAFEGLDTDKNSELSEEEWNRSRVARKLFTEGKVEVKFPFPKAKFVEHYVKLAP